jgi:succinate dehydrogenase/fumarate reductase flavoprotein subunit
MGIAPDRLKKTIERYNELCEKGVDTDFDVPQNCLNPIKTPPYYALRENINMLLTVSGLRITPQSEVIDKETQAPIPGIYAVGNVSGGMFLGTYAHHVNGVSHSRCVTFGYLLGKRLAGLL